MKKSELKNIIKECVREVIFEEGVLANIVTEVAQGIGASQVVQEHRVVSPRQANSQKMTATRKKMLDAVAANSYEAAKNKFANPELFEGTKPLTESNGKSALAGTDPNDAGVDISNIPGFGNWSNVASATRK
tara:strand:+ start:1336 stop:1731 length:396 start_codon:yes stop_codon:yes gene_type:complete